MLRFAIGQVQFNKLQYYCFLVPHFRFCNFFLYVYNIIDLLSALIKEQKVFILLMFV